VCAQHGHPFRMNIRINLGSESLLCAGLIARNISKSQGC